VIGISGGVGLRNRLQVYFGHGAMLEPDFDGIKSWLYISVLP